MYSIGLDIGTTGLCGVLINCETGKIELTRMVNSDSFIETDVPYEKIQDTAVIFEKLDRILAELIEFAGKDNVCSIGVSNQMHGIVYTDDKINAVSPLYIWQDERGNLEYRDGKTYAGWLNSFAGYGLVTDFYNRENSLVPDGAVYCCTVGDLEVMRLTGRRKPLMHVTNAASFGCFDVVGNCFTLDNGMLPDVTADFECAGYCNGIPVCVAVGDNQASFIGSVRGDMPLINIGTGSQISYLSDTADSPPNAEVRPFDGKRYLIVGASLCGGRAFAILERFFAMTVELATGERPDNLYPQMDKMLKNMKKTDMRADTRFCGTRFDPSIRGGFFNVSEKNFTPEDITVSVLYAIADELKKMCPDKSSDFVVCSGNGIRKNPALREIVSDVFNAGLKMPAHKEEAAFGAALASLCASGKYSALEQAQELIKYES